MGNFTVDEARDVIRLTSEYNGARTRLAVSTSQQRNSLLRDYSQTGLAILGGTLTIITVEPALVKTPTLMYVGAALTLISVIVAFISRHILSKYLKTFLADEAAYYFKVVNPAREVIRDPEDSGASKVLEHVAKNENVPNTKLSWLGEWGDRIVGAVLLGGGLCVAISLMLNVSL
ncbi:MAG TPA: hypothetical protein VM581_03750 [Magnetospirillaceae bacterium]|nr:hypothetical protein [Magnetospirillaceae bacterium]